MEEDGVAQSIADAQEMLALFGSVGATRFDVTWTDSDGQKQRFRRGMHLATLAAELAAILPQADQQQLNVIVRPDGPGVSFIQLDDLATGKLPALLPPVFLALETSPGNFQAWVALEGSEDKDLARRLRKGVGADATASGATRIAGSRNFKAKYAPAFPRVRIHAAQPGRVTQATELIRLGLVAPAERPAPPRAEVSSRPSSRRRWPDYGRCLEGAPLNSEETGPDVSRADFVWCMTAISWGWSVADTAGRLMAESTKAHANGKGYAELTARNAALAVARRENSRQTLGS